MHCRFCGFSNREGDLRCSRCDGRLQAQPVITGRSSALPVSQADTQPVPAQPATPEPRGTVAPRQASLFDRGNVLSFPGPATRALRALALRSGAPRPQKTDPRPQKAQASRANTTHSGKTLSETMMSATQERLLGISGQQNFNFLSHGAAESHRTRRSEAPVAAPMVRLKAAGFDALVVLSAIALSLVPFYLAGGRIVASSTALVGYGAYGVVMALFYKVFWCVLKRESAGMSQQGIRLVDFDGEVPGCARRWVRLGAVLLGSLAAGIGLLWALMDQERLAWHDHISKTYPTVDNPNPGTFHRR